MNITRRMKTGIVAAVIGAGGLTGVGFGIAHAVTPTAPPAVSVDHQTQSADQPEPGDHADAPGAVDRPEAGDHADAPGAVDRPEAGDHADAPGAVDRPEAGDHADAPGAVDQPEAGDTSDTVAHR
ncbi:MAG: hypothetical protein WBA05_08225 [Gordonia sp. (in: high G+C Gram-positive bacteria)]|uniref:hypothetical protein n=1 Tax=Gordonia sp. (in: high G+C Gram-positive bacteria) TaxID=84139 RepID=UPI003C70E25D